MAPLQIHASGLGISGSFGQAVFTMVAGESFRDPSVKITLVNPGSEDLTVKLSASGPEGFRIDFKEEVLILPKQSSVSFSVSFSLSDTVTPGRSTISVTATILSSTSGIAVSGFATLSATLIVMGEAGHLNVSVTDVRNKPFDATLQITRITDSGTEIPCVKTDTGSYSGRLVPGTYKISALIKDTEVASETVILKDQDDLSVILVARPILFSLFLAAPVFDENGLLKQAGLAYTITNLGPRETQVSLQIRILKDGKMLDQSEALTLPILDLGTLSGRLSVLPPKGFQSGSYDFQLILISEDGVVLAQSSTQGFLVKMKNPIAWEKTLWAVPGLAGFWWMMKRKKRPS